MPKKKTFKEGIRVNVWIPPAQRNTARDIDNLSRFFQICLDNAADIMAWAILRDVDPEKYYPLHEEDRDEQFKAFNQMHPLDPLTTKRLRKPKSRKNYLPPPELW